MSATMIKEFRLPDLGEGLTESEILSWKVAVGDTVSLNQVIAEVETAKAVVELPSPFAGVIKELHEQPGSVVEVGKPIVSFEVADDAGASPSTPSGALPAKAEESVVETPKREPNLVGYGAVVEGSGRPARRRRNFARRSNPSKPRPSRRSNPSKPSLSKTRSSAPVHASCPQAGQGPGVGSGTCARHWSRWVDHARRRPGVRRACGGTCHPGV